MQEMVRISGGNEPLGVECLDRGWLAIPSVSNDRNIVRVGRGNGVGRLHCRFKQGTGGFIEILGLNILHQPSASTRSGYLDFFEHIPFSEVSTQRTGYIC